MKRVELLKYLRRQGCENKDGVGDYKRLGKRLGPDHSNHSINYNGYNGHPISGDT